MILHWNWDRSAAHYGPAIGEKHHNQQSPRLHCASKKTGIPELNCGRMKVGETMMERKLSIAEIMLIGGTRVALGVGIGLLISGKLNSDQRKAAGLALALVGGLTTIPLAIGVIGKRSAEIRPAA
jgi:hypothetical protein